MSVTTTIIRRPDAALRLRMLLAPRLAGRFEWGTRDCVLLAADAAHAVTGHDPMADLRDRYANARQAMRLLRSLGGMWALAEARFGRPRIRPLDGDTVLLRAAGPADDELALGVWCAGGIMAQGERALVIRPAADAMGVWGWPCPA